jgi:hypothetical protein
MNKLISGAILAAGIVLAIYGSASKSFSSDLTHSDDMGARTRNAIETRENLLTQVELVPLDPQGNPVTFSPEVVGLPKRAHFDPQTNTLVWRPWYSDAGTYELLFHDIGSEYTQKIVIQVEDVPLKSWYQEWIQSDPVQSAMVE